MTEERYTISLIEVDQGSKQISKLSDDALVVGELILNFK
jgi:hypothetical protein